MKEISYRKTMNRVKIEQLMILDQKERILAEIIVWLKARGIWEECKKDLVSKDLLQSTEETTSQAGGKTQTAANVA